MKEIARLQLRQPRLDRIERALEPVAIPQVDLVLRVAERVLEVLQHRQIIDRVDLGRDPVGQFAHSVARLDILGQEGGIGVGLVEPFQQRHRLRPVPPVRLQHRQRAEGVAREEFGRLVLACQQADRHVFEGEALQVQRDPEAVGGGTAEVAKQAHQNAAIPVIARPRISAWTSCVPS